MVYFHYHLSSFSRLNSGTWMEVDLGGYIMARRDMGMAGWVWSGYTRTGGSWLCEEGRRV